MAENDESNTQNTEPAQDALALSQLSPAELQALFEKVMALLKRDLQVERERLHGR